MLAPTVLGDSEERSMYADKACRQMTRATRVVLAVIAAGSTLACAASVYIGRTAMVWLAEIDVRLEIVRLPIPGEEPHLRAARVLQAATEKRNAQSVLWLCRASALVCTVVLAAAAAALVGGASRASVSSRSGSRRIVDDVFHIVPRPDAVAPSGQPSAIANYTPETCCVRQTG
jgi:hypothetical protein